ncbi:hypothetical protein D3C77_364620 [compost metagenome]
MSWYRDGTVAVTNGSSTITGTNTNFAANARVGDAFIGPDGVVREVSNIASETVLSVFPAYSGATASGASYTLAPLQGYVKQLADQAQQIIQQWGATLAGLGTAAFAALTTSPTDTIPGRVTRVGDYGWGGGAPQDSPINNATFGSVVRTYNDPGSPTAGTYVGLHLQREPGGRSADVLLGDSPSTMHWRTKNGAGVAGPWNNSYSNRNILGPVSQLDGIPTGAIIERVELSSGTYVRFACGTMWCYRSALESLQATIALGPLFISAAASNFTFPKAFVGIPFVIPFGAAYATSIGWAALDSQATASTTGSIKWISPLNGSAGYVGYLAIGRWY